MVRALLAGTKTQTRRIVKALDLEWMDVHQGLREPDNAERCPYGQPGDRLWVRETFRGCRGYEVQGYRPKDWGNKPIWFEADGTPPGRPDHWALRSSPSINMPRWASRITLEVTGVRVERLQDISEADARAEGIFPHVRGGWYWLKHDSSNLDDWNQFDYKTAALAFRALWVSINGPDSWAANPWVWVIEFKRVKGDAA